MVPDLTKIQREHEKKMREDVAKLNSERNEEESKNFEWKLVGPRGERRKVKSKPATTQQERRVADTVSMETVRTSPRLTRHATTTQQAPRGAGYRGGATGVRH